MDNTARKRFILWATFGWVALALAWIFFSDQLLSSFSDMGSVVWASTAKGAFFVAASAVGFYFVLTAVASDKPNTGEQFLHTQLVNVASAHRPAWLTYPFAVAITLVMVLVRHWLKIEFGDRPMLLIFILPIILSALLGGFGPGLISTAVAALGVDYLAIPPMHSLHIGTNYDLLLWGFLIVDGIAISMLSETMRRSQIKCEVNRRLIDAVISGTTDAVFVKDRQGRYLLVNAAAARVIGRAPADIIGLDDNALFQSVTGHEIRATDQAVMASGQTHTYEQAFAGPEGKSIYLATKGPLLDESGKVVGIFGISRDISERKLAAKELDQHREHLEDMVAERTQQLEAANLSLAAHDQFIRTVTDAIPSLLAYFNADLRCRFVNAAYSKWFNKRPEEMIGIHLTELLGEKQFQISEPYVLAVLRGEHQQFHRPLTRADGSTGYTEVSYIRKMDGDRVDGFYVLVSDISELKQAELKLTALNDELAFRAQQAESANTAKSAFLANMSHEIRTPMNAIVGLTHLLRRANPTPEQSARLDKINSAGCHLLSIINDILDISKIEADRLKLESVDFHLSSVLDNIQSILADDARAKGLSLTIDADAAPVWLRGDPTRLRQALLNYAANAIKFTERGSIALRVQLMEELLLRFEVQDTGIGIPADKLSGIFQSFEQADSSTTRRYGGTGLGLTITRRLASMMGGEANVTSMEGAGSTFWFTARLSRGHGIMPSAPVLDDTNAEAELRRRFAGARLLLAEDNAINCEVTMELLHAVGLTAETAANGIEAVTKARTSGYDLILMDMQMPEMDGLEATRAIRALADKTEVPILAMTANAFDEDRRTCLAAGMNDFVSKPVDPAVFFATVLKWLSRKQGTAAAPANEKNMEADIDGSKPAAASEAPSQIPTLPGIDTTVGLHYARGKVSFYVKLLKKFREGHGANFMRELEEARLSGDWQAGERLAHTLKGLAGTLGAKALGDIAAMLEHATSKQQARCAFELEETLGRELAHVMNGLSRLDEIATAAGESVESGHAQEAASAVS